MGNVKFPQKCVEYVFTCKKCSLIELERHILQTMSVKAMYMCLMKDRRVNFPEVWGMWPTVRFDLSWRNLGMVSHYDYDYNVHVIAY